MNSTEAITEVTVKYRALAEFNNSYCLIEGLCMPQTLDRVFLFAGICWIQVKSHMGLNHLIKIAIMLMMRLTTIFFHSQLISAEHSWIKTQENRSNSVHETHVKIDSKDGLVKSANTPPQNLKRQELQY